jgi:hypothetical protein
MSRTRQIAFTLSEEHYQLLVSMVDNTGDTVSNYCRRMVVQSLKGQLYSKEDILRIAKTLEAKETEKKGGLF